MLGLLGVGLFRARPSAVLGKPAPGFSLPDLRSPGRTISLAGLRGRPVVVNFWASWCDPCRAEAPELVEVWEAHREDVTFLGINILDGRDEALDFLKEYGVGYQTARDASGRVAKQYGVTGIPETVFIDGRGNVVGKFIGSFAPGQLEPLVSSLVALPPGDTLDITGRGETRPVP